MRCASYTRMVSCMEKGEIPNDIISQQNERIQKYIKQRKWKLVKKYSDRKKEEFEETACKDEGTWSAWKNGDVVCAGCSQGCKTDLRFAAGLHKERNTGCLSIPNADRRCITVRTGWHFGYYCAWMAVARYPMMRELLIFIRETVCLCRRIQKSLRFTDRRSSLISEDKIQNSRVWGKTGR